MPLFEAEAPEIIRARILDRIGTELQTREGSYTYDMVSPTAFELWRVLMTLDELIAAFYVDEYSGKYLDAHAALLALERKEGTQATAAVTFTGKDGVTVPAGTAFFTAAGLEYDLVDDVTLEDGVGAGQLLAAAVGDEYNADAGEIDQILRNITGLTGFAVGEATGGTDAESDADLFARIDARRKNPGSSGNEAHYVEWALACDGVGAVKATGLWNGPGTVRVLIVGYDLEPVDDAVVAACAEYIETVRPVGAEVTVVSAAGAEISVSATLKLAASATLSSVTAAFKAGLTAYFADLASEYFADTDAHEYTLYYNRVAALLMDVAGVLDYSDLTVNGGTANITLDETSVPMLGEVTLT